MAKTKCFEVEEWLDVETLEGIVKFPKIIIGDPEDGGIPELNCAMYARILAGMLGRHYEPCNGAWNFRYHYKTVDVESYPQLKVAHNKGLLRPGYIVGFQNAYSTMTDQLDERGQPAAYTHVATFLGKSPEDPLLFGHQIVRERVVLTPREMHARGLKPWGIFLPIKER